MFESFGDFFWTFMAMSGFMFWICMVIFYWVGNQAQPRKKKDFL